MREVFVDEAVKTYFANRFPQFSVLQRCEIQFGTRHGVADIVLHQPMGDEQGRFIAIVECKPSSLPVLRYRARAQLKSYMSATNTRFGVFAVDTDPQNWEFYENKYNNWFAEIKREDFERGIENWKSLSIEALAVNWQDGQRTARWWQKIALTFALVFVITSLLFLRLWPSPPEPIVYITRTGKEYHTYDCEFLQKHNVKQKFAIYLDKVEKNYDRCQICY